MDALAQASNIVLEVGGDPHGDIIFISTNDTGMPGELSSSVLRRMGQDENLTPRPDLLAPGYAFLEIGKQKFCFIVTVAMTSTEQLLRRNLANALSQKMEEARELWIPLMGTGAGKLSFDQSEEIIRNTLMATGWADRSDVRIVIAAPEGYSSRSTAQRESSWGPAANEALRGSSQLARGRKASELKASSTMLFFALSARRKPGALKNLAEDRDANLFTGAVHSLAGKDFQVAWDEYFDTNFQWRGDEDIDESREVSSALGSVLDHAQELAIQEGSSVATVHMLIVALLSAERGNHLDRMATMGCSAAKLLEAYEDARLGKVGTRLLNDVAGIEDRLDYDKYAEAFKDFLVDEATLPPLSISIQAPWGAGKSSLMQQIRQKLDPKEDRERRKGEPYGIKHRLELRDVLAFLDGKHEVDIYPLTEANRRWTIWFNAWKYDSSEQVWAGLVDAIVTQVSDRLLTGDRELFLLRLQLARIDDGIVRKKIYDRVLTIWIANTRALLMVGATVIAALFGAHSAADHFRLDESIRHIAAWSPIGASVLLVLAVVLKYVQQSNKTKSEPASFSLAQYIQVPDYNQTLGKVHHVHCDLMRVLSVLPRAQGMKTPLPLVIFIDDLDRCSPASVANVVEGISMFLASDDYNCMFVIGMDPQMIAAALEDAHAKVRQQLPNYERTVPLGWRFMDKFIQLPFTIPSTRKKTLDAYVEALSRKLDKEPKSAVEQPEPMPRPTSFDLRSIADDVGRPKSDDPPSPPQPAPSQPDEVEKEFEESRDVGIIIREAMEHLSGNPREIKRLTNLARLYLALRNKAREQRRTWRTPDTLQYARWIVLTIKWPDMMRWLQWGADDGKWDEHHKSEEPSMELTARRLQFLEEAAHEVNAVAEWSKKIAHYLHLPDDKPSDWACDPKLFEFFQKEAGLDQDDRLSVAAHHGFW
jgi:hypothetical protein